MPNKFFLGGVAVPVRTPFGISCMKMNFGFGTQFLAGRWTGKKSQSDHDQRTARNCSIWKELESRTRNVGDETGTEMACQICGKGETVSSTATDCGAPEDNGSVKNRLKANDFQFERWCLENGDHANAAGYLRWSARSLW